MYLQGKDSVYDIQWNEHVTYGQIYHQNEVEQSRYNFDESDAAMHREHFDQFEAQWSSPRCSGTALARV